MEGRLGAEKKNRHLTAAVYMRPGHKQALLGGPTKWAFLLSPEFDFINFLSLGCFGFRYSMTVDMPTISINCVAHKAY